jgi:hypothetical protein
MTGVRLAIVSLILILSAGWASFAQIPVDPNRPAIAGDDPKRTLLIDRPFQPPPFRDAERAEAEMRYFRGLGLTEVRARAAGARNASLCLAVVVLFNATALAYARFRGSKA